MITDLRVKLAQASKLMNTERGQLLPGELVRWTDPVCGNYQSFVIRPPTFTKDKNVCDESGCNVDDPMGGWTTPLLIPGIVAGAVVAIRLFTTAPAAIPAMSVLSIEDSATGIELGPALVKIGRWSTGRNRQLYPGWGNQSQATVGGVPLLNIQEQQTEQLFLTSSYYTEQVIQDGQNNVPNKMAGVNTQQGQEGYGYSLSNGKAREIDVTFKMYVAYNSRDVTAAG